MQANKRDQKSNAKSAAASAKALKQAEEVKNTADAKINKIAEEDSPVSNASFSSSENQQVSEIPAGKMHPVPKRPISSFLLFTIDNQTKLRESRPDGVKNKSITETAIELGNRWQLLSDKDKQKYQTLFEQDKTRYKNQLEEVKTNGYFVMDDGQKSNQVLVNIPRTKDNAKKVATRTRGTQTGKEWSQNNLAELVKAKTDKIEMKIEAEVKKRVKTLLKKRSHTPTERPAKKVMKVEASTSVDKSARSDKKLTSKTPVKSQSASKSEPQKATEFGNLSRSRSRTPQKGQASVKVKTEPTSASKQKSSGVILSKMAHKETQSSVVRSKQTKKRSQALAQGQ